MNNTVQKIFKRKKQLKILVLGDLILDEYIWGTVDRISPEAPVQVVDTKSVNIALGGSANVVHNLAVLGCKVYAAGLVGNDGKGRALVEELNALNVNCKGVIIDSHKPTTNKIRVIANSQQVLRIDKEDKNPISSDVEKKLIKFLKNTVKDMDGVICSDYQKGVITKKILKTVFTEAKKNDIKVLIDPKGTDYSLYKGAAIITPNEKELIAATSAVKSGKKDIIERRANSLLRLLGSESILVTRGRDGMALFEKDGGKTVIKTDAKEVFDVTGAGDTVISMFGICLFSGVEPPIAAKMANRAAGIVVAKVGTSIVSKEEFIASVEEGKIFSGGKVIKLDELKRIVSLAKSQKRKIIFTNGCFDLLHVGHIKYLEDAKKLGDILIVGLNDDSTVRKLKGSKRPLISEDQRANILAALNCIDYVVIFSEETPERLIKELLPHILVKGGDYSIDQVVGRKTVEANGGEVRLIPVEKNVSTSKIVKSIVEKYS